MVNYLLKTKKMLLKEVAKFKYGMGNTIPNDGGKYPVYGCNGIVGYTSKYNNEDTAIIGHIGSAGVVVWATGKHYVTYNGTICKANENIVDKYYLYYQLLFLELENYLKGGQPFLSITDFNKLSIYIPPLKEQKAIVDTLSVFDIHIKNLIRLIEKKRAIRNGVMWELFSAKSRIKEYEHNWIEVSLSKICKIYDGTHQTPTYTMQGIPFVSVENMTDIYGTDKYISDKDFQKNFKVFPEKGDILMTRIGDIGTSCVVKMNKPLAFYVSLALFKNIKINSEFLNYYISSQCFHKELDDRTLHHATPKKINKEEIGKCKILYPLHIQEQQAIVEVLSAIDDEIISLEKELDKIKQIREGAMDDLLTGRIRLAI